MTKTQIIEQVAKNSGLEKKQAKSAIEGLTKLIETTIKKGGQVPLTGLGKFKVAAQNAWAQPATGGVKIAAAVVKFTAKNQEDLVKKK
jgi:DNA-binding protein HU-beta